MTSNTLKENVGKTVLWTPTAFPNCSWQAMVKDAKTTFGRTDLLITPVSGQGEQWVSAESCKPQETK